MLGNAFESFLLDWKGYPSRFGDCAGAGLGVELRSGDFFWCCGDFYAEPRRFCRNSHVPNWKPDEEACHLCRENLPLSSTKRWKTQKDCSCAPHFRSCPAFWFPRFLNTHLLLGSLEDSLNLRRNCLKNLIQIEKKHFHSTQTSYSSNCSYKAPECQNLWNYLEFLAIVTLMFLA